MRTDPTRTHAKRWNILTEQLRVIGPPHHPGTLVVAALALLVSLTASLSVSTGVDEVAFPRGLGVYPIIWVIAAVWTRAVWPDRDSWRAAHLVMPVDRATHDLLRVGAGLVWLLAGALAVTLMALVAALSASGPPAGLWLMTLTTGPAIIYLAVTTAALGSRHRGIWILGVLGGYAILAALAGTAVGPLRSLVLWPLTGPLGLTWALGIPFLSMGPEAVRPAIIAWLPATLLWLTVAMAGVYAVAGRRRAE
jgi:hypothetical protein